MAYNNVPKKVKVYIDKDKELHKEKKKYPLFELTDLLTSMAGLLATTEDMQIYVSTTGDDDTGDGTSSKPFKTVARALELVPLNVRHKVVVKITSDLTEFPAEVAYFVTGNGQMSFEGIGDAPVYLADLVVDTFDTNGYKYCEITVAGATWTPNDFWGKFIRVTSGAAEGLEIAIDSNTADTIVFHRINSTISATDTFDIVDPPISIAVDHEVTFNQLGGNTEGKFYNARMALRGLAFEYTATADITEPFRLANGTYYTGLTRFKVPYDSSIWTQLNDTLTVRNGALNNSPLLDMTVFEGDFVEPTVQLIYGDSPNTDLLPWAMRIDNAVVKNFCYWGKVYVSGECRVERFCAGNIIWFGAYGKIESGYFNHHGQTYIIDTQSEAIRVIAQPEGCHCYMSRLHIEDILYRDAIHMSWQTEVEIGSVSGNVANISRYGCYMTKTAQLAILGGSGSVDIAGAAGEIYVEGIAATKTWTDGTLPVLDTYGGWLSPIFF